MADFSTRATHQQRQELLDRLQSALAAAQKERPQRQETIVQPDGTQELGWIVYERDLMFREVNRARSELGLPPVELKVVERAERKAVGSADYPLKFALYCRDVVLDENG